MDVRRAALAGRWYPDTPRRCLEAVKRCLPSAAPDPTSTVVGGIVPHAGWTYSGPTAGATLAAVGAPPPDTVIVFGFSHRSRLLRSQISGAGVWETPLGALPVDRRIANRLIEAAPDLLEEGDEGHPPGENSIEVLAPFLRHLFPDAGFLPIAVAQNADSPELGRRIGTALSTLTGRSVVFGSTDLTHYGQRNFGFAPRGRGAEAHRWSKEVNDRAFLDRILALDPEGAYATGREDRSACGAGSAAAAAAAAKAMGATGARLLEHTTSFEASPDGDEPRDFVGYAAVVFDRLLDRDTG